MEKELQAHGSFGEQYQKLNAHLVELNYSRRSLRRYDEYSRRIEKTLKEGDRKDSEFSKDTCDWLIQQYMGSGTFQALSKYYKAVIHCALTVLEYSSTGRIYEYTQPRTPQPESPLSNDIEGYCKSDAAKGRTEKTLQKKHYYLKIIEGYYSTTKAFQRWSQLGRTDVFDFIESIASCSPSQMCTYLGLLKGFLSYLYDEGRIEENLAVFVPRSSYKGNPEIPSVYSKDEIELLLDSLNRASPLGKRNYVIILIAARLGLRASDIARLEFSCLVWEKSYISLIQYKTKEPLVLPLTNEIGSALIDYLKYSRPMSNSPRVFLKLNAPFKPIEDAAVSSIVSRAFKKSGITIANRKHGSHALRFSLAMRLLDSKTPIPIIAKIYGHASTQTTMKYLSIDEEALKQCALEVAPYTFKEAIK